MLGSVIGDIIGSVFEWYNVKTTEFDLFSRSSRYTDDSVMTVAIADAILNINNGSSSNEKLNNEKQYAIKLKEYGNKFPDAGYGQMFKEWLANDCIPKLKSFGNGSAMRVSLIGLAFDSIEKVIEEAKKKHTVYS